MSRIPTYFSPTYAPPDSPILTRLAVAARHLDEAGLVALNMPPPLRHALLQGLHSDEYLRAFDTGVEPLASTQGIAWTPAVRDSSYAMLAGQLAAARRAMDEGVAMNLARGFHHAVRARGAGYCALNGLALVAHALPRFKVFVIDCDEHGGNGTEEYAAELPNLYQASVFGTRFGCRGGTRSWAFMVSGGDDPFWSYRHALQRIAELLFEVRPDIILYQAGVDCHLDDPKSRARISEAQLLERDRWVFACAHALQIPISFLVAGGYQHADIVARLNANTVRAARDVFHGIAS